MPPGWRQSGATMRAGSESDVTSIAFIDHEAALRMAARDEGLRAATNKITVENAKLGNPPSEWMINGIGDDTIVGFATYISVNRGQAVSFKIRTNSLDYRIDIYRLGYYGGNGARKVATIQRQLATPQTQPNPGGDPSIGLVDCGNWAVSATWTVPSTEVTGLYIAKLVRQDATAGVSHIPFVVRDDGVASDLLFQTSDTTWCAYNSWGGHSLYGGDLPAFRAYKVSYNRPYNTRGYDFQSGPQDWIFGVEYPMIRWLERNGYDVSYSTGVDSDRRGAEILLHKIFLSVGHDEYWSGPQRANVEAARDAGVNLAFFSGNECYWKTRWESSVAGPATPYRTLVCYKESRANAKIDPSPTWTGTWRDPRFSPPSDGGRPENALTGTIFQVDSYRLDTIKVPYENSRFRFAQHQLRQPVVRADGLAGKELSRLRVGRGPRQRLPAGRPDRPVANRAQRHDLPARLRLDHRRRDRQPQPNALPRPERRRARVRGGHGLLGLGSRLQPRQRSDSGRSQRAAGDGEPAGRHGRPARHAAS
jgi:hypothetical protein